MGIRRIPVLQYLYLHAHEHVIEQCFALRGVKEIQSRLAEWRLAVARNQQGMTGRLSMIFPFDQTGARLEYVIAAAHGRWTLGIKCTQLPQFTVSILRCALAVQLYNMGAAKWRGKADIGPGMPFVRQPNAFTRGGKRCVIGVHSHIGLTHVLF